MDSGTSGESMQSGSSREDDQNDTSSFSAAGVASIPRLQHQHQLPLTTHLHQQPSFSSQQQLHHYTNLTSMNTTRDHDNNISGYNNPSPHLFSTNSFLETLPQSDLDRIWSMSMNVNPNSHHHQQQQLLYSSTSLLTPSSSTMNPNQALTIHEDPQPRPIRKISSLATLPVKENGSSSGRAVVKKRTRASRKTPTTVLTTDTTNFRAMVQEFTGIPTPPFSPSSLFPAKKFDTFCSNNGLDHRHPLGSLLFSLNKSTNNNNLNSSPFAQTSITTASLINPLATERNQSGNPNPYQYHSQQILMLPQGSNSTFLNQLPQGSDHIKNPNMSFHHSSSIPQRPPFPSKYSGNEADQVGAFSNVERGENDNISRTS